MLALGLLLGSGYLISSLALFGAGKAMTRKEMYKFRSQYRSMRDPIRIPE